MDQSYGRDIERAGLNLFEVVSIAGRQFVLRPESRAFGQRVEQGQINQDQRRLLVITSNDPRVELANLFDNGVRIRPITDEVSAPENLVILTGGMLQNGIKRFQVGMDVTQNQKTHDCDSFQLSPVS